MNRKPAKPPLNDADGATIMSWCIQMTALAAREFEGTGEIDPQFYESLKALQMHVDRGMHKLHKRDIKSSLEKMLPSLPSRIPANH